jgi:DNA-binding IclR family transcriptional regulator
VPSFEAAELLLFLARHREADWSLPEALGRLRPAVSIGDAEAARYLETFRAQGLVAAAGERVRYQPVSYLLDRHIEALAAAYRERPVTLIRMIYALRDSRIQSFADAFRIRRK